MKKKKKLLRASSRLVALKRASERRAKSCFIVVIFFAVFACMLVTEVFYVEDERWREEKYLSMFNFGDDVMETVSSSNRVVARELTRVKYSEENETAGEDYWQTVSHTKDKFFVYSAYYDDRRTKWVRVIAVARTRLADKVVCRFSYNNRSPVTVIGINRLIRENWNLKYSAYFILCPVKQSPVPDHVSIIREGDSVGNKIIVKNNKEQYKRPEGVAVCIKPLHYEYNKVKNLIEFIELNRIIGVNHFVLYNHTIGTEVGCILQKYIVEGVVTVLPWQLDIISQKEIRTEGLFAAINDCLYRTMYRFRYVLMIDLDEYVIPHKNNSLRVMLDYLMKKNPDRTGAFSFQNAFFYLQWPDDSSVAGIPYRLLTLQKTTRKAKFHAHKQRSKCIILPERVVEMGNHFVWEFITGKTMMNIPPDVGFLHHYRVCEFGGNDCINTTHVTDRRTYAWKDAMIDMISLRLRLLQPVCQNISPFLLQ